MTPCYYVDDIISGNLGGSQTRLVLWTKLLRRQMKFSQTANKNTSINARFAVLIVDDSQLFIFVERFTTCLRGYRDLRNRKHY